METQTIAPVSQSEVLRAFRSDAWLMELASSVGVAVSDIPKDVREAILASETKNWVNRKFFDWFTSRKIEVQGFTPADETLFKQVVSLRRSPEYQNTENILTKCLNSSREYFSQAQNQLANAALHRIKLMQLENTSSIDLSEEIKACVADGWYKYDSKLTSEFNKGKLAHNLSLVFVTSRVVAKFYNKSAGIEMDVDLGRYKVVYTPMMNMIRVYAHEDNVKVGDHIHPHVAYDSGVCWGNAKEVYVHAMNECKPSKALLALRVILTNYNDESPYVDLYRFAVTRNPKMVEGKEIIYQVSNRTVWIRSDDLPAAIPLADIRDEHENDDGERELAVRTHRQYYEGTTVPCDENEYFLRLLDPEHSRYVVLDEDIVTDEY